MLLFWPLIGAAIGAYAAQKKGFSTIGGVIGGLLLGPLAFLLFFVSGIVSSNEQQRKCPYCAEWIRPEASVCKHCHKDVPPSSTGVTASTHGMSMVLKVVLVFAAGFFALIIWVMMTSSPSSPSSSAGFTSVFEPVVTMSKFSQLQTGITYSEAVQIIGTSGQEMSRSDLAGYSTVMYGWQNPSGSNMNAMFQNDKLVNKAQFGLR